MKQLLTHSRKQCYKQCRKRHFFAYECGLRKITDSAPLRMGTAFHAGQETIGKGGTVDDAIESIRRCYEEKPDFIESLEWDYERTTVECLTVGHAWRWSTDPIEHIETEKQFRLPIINPETGRSTPVFDSSGKMDGIVRRNGRVLLREIKLLGEDVSPDSNLWKRLRLDNQISTYTDAARLIGYEVEAVLFDATKKPGIKPNPVPTTDDNGFKIVLDANDSRVFNKAAAGKEAKPRQTADSELGYRLLTRPMTVEEWSARLMSEIADNPDKYFCRQEVARLDLTLDEYRKEAWDIQRDIRESQKSGKWYRTVTKDCSFCPYFFMCDSAWKPGDQVPDGMEVVADVHQELVLMEAT